MIAVFVAFEGLNETVAWKVEPARKFIELAFNATLETLITADVVTVTVTVENLPDPSFAEALIKDVPAETPVTTPDEFTVATPVFPDDHVTVLVPAFIGKAVAINVKV